MQRETPAAWKDVKSKGSSGGVNGQNISDFEKDLGNNLLEIAAFFEEGCRYRPYKAKW
ncbi:MAG: hypothetical protein IJ940_02770 [Bacteroidales bacterium]|nr:hypothetical protein [Bacteroidales bacterium]